MCLVFSIIIPLDILEPTSSNELLWTSLKNIKKYVVSKTLHRVVFNSVFRSNMFYMLFIWNVLEWKNIQVNYKRSRILLDFLKFFNYLQTEKRFNVLRVNSQRFQSFSLSLKIPKSKPLNFSTKNAWKFEKLSWKFQKSIDIKYNVVVLWKVAIKMNGYFPKENRSLYKWD